LAAADVGASSKSQLPAYAEIPRGTGTPVHWWGSAANTGETGLMSKFI